MKIKLHNSIHPVISVMAIGVSVTLFFYIVVAAHKAYDLEDHIVSTQRFIPEPIDTIDTADATDSVSE